MGYLPPADQGASLFHVPGLRVGLADVPEQLGLQAKLVKRMLGGEVRWRLSHIPGCGMLWCFMLQPIDIVVALKLSLLGGEDLSFEQLEGQTTISSSSLHRSTGRLQAARLVMPNRRVHRRALVDLLLHGVRYVYYVQPGQVTRGQPTAWAAPPLNEVIASKELPPVWPDPLGEARGVAITPLHASALNAARADPALFELLALVDALRIGNSRERDLAAQFLSKRILEDDTSMAGIRYG